MIRHSQGKTKSDAPTDAEKQHVEKMKAIMTEFLKFRANFRNTTKSQAEMLEYSLQMMYLSTDCPTIFNFRKDLLEIRVQEILGSADPVEAKVEALGKVAQAELKELFKMAMTDPKSYEIWFHRIWMIEKFLKSEREVVSGSNLAQKMIAEDLLITAKYLSKDERNFHVWNYRLELNRLLLDFWPDQNKETIGKEFAFILLKLGENFSNYSAIQFYTKYVERKLEAEQPEGQRQLLASVVVPQLHSNYEHLVVSPNEQALWLFQIWLVARLNSQTLIGAKRVGDRELELWFNRKITSRTLLGSLDWDCKPATVENISESVVKIGYSGHLPDKIVYKNGTKRVVLEVAGVGESLGLVEDSQQTEFESDLTQVLQGLSEIEIEAEQSKVFLPIIELHLQKELKLNRFFASEEELRSLLHQIKTKIAGDIQQVATTPYARKLAARLAADAPTARDLLRELGSV